MDKDPNILIIEDDESARKILTMVLGKKGYATETACTGQGSRKVRRWKRKHAF